ncbi:MlaD family protein [Mycobacterium sp. SMC-18]|jgi:phospholipid/cholesterol/gamma-HCH transport system substrate-binding protein|uniref:MlaD family protein n=1 Tax=Mycobacteriaceae TaxID=1762 RepID=UPI000FBB66AD|nr:MlaD family protein [Mycolicibacterium sp.]RUP28138.1 MAG: MCE family protein [Mycolicibacterium sp.]
MRIKRSTIIGLALFMVFSVAVTWMVFATLQRNIAGPTSSYSAIFSDVSGLAEGDDVRVAGVRVGRVDKIELTPDNKAKVDFQVRSNQTLYASTLASVTYQNIIGQRYLGLSQGDGERRKMPAGAQIPEQRTNPSFDISYMLNGFEPLFTELDPQQVDNLTNAIIEAFQGNQGSLLTLTTQASSLTQTLAGPDAALGDLIANLDKLMATLATQSKNLETMLHQTSVSLSSLNSRRDELVASVGAITANVTRLSALVDAITPDVQQFIDRDPGLLKYGVGEGKPRLAFALANVPLLLKGLARMTQDGSYGNIYACDLDFGLWRGLLNWFRMFVIRATPGNGNEVWHSAVCQ